MPKDTVATYKLKSGGYSREEYKRLMLRKLPPSLQAEIEKLSAPDRRVQAVLARTRVVRRLRDEFLLSFPDIGTLLDRDHSSVHFLYNKKSN